MRKGLQEEEERGTSGGQPAPTSEGKENVEEGEKLVDESGRDNIVVGPMYMVGELSG